MPDSPLSGTYMQKFFPGGNRKVIRPEKNEVRESGKKKKKELVATKKGGHHSLNTDHAVSVVSWKFLVLPIFPLCSF